MKVTLVMLVIILAITPSVVLLHLAKSLRAEKRKIGKVLGGIGIAANISAWVAILDAFSQIWVKRLGYEGWPVYITLSFVSTVWLISIIFCAIIILENNRLSRVEK